jgi:hypothetical protein
VNASHEMTYSKASFTSHSSVSKNTESVIELPQIKQQSKKINVQIAPSVFEIPVSIKPAKSNPNAVRPNYKKPRY